MSRLDDLERWPETKAVMKAIENEVLGVDYEANKTLKDHYEQLLILKEFVSALDALWLEYGRTRCFTGAGGVKAIYDKLNADVDKARGFTVERKSDYE